MGSLSRAPGTTLESPVCPDHRPDLQASRQEIQEYLDQQGAYDLFDYLLKELLTKQPADPMEHMLKCLETEHPLGPLKVVMHSPPNVGRAGYAKRLAEHWGLEYISAAELLRENSMDTGSFAPDTAISELVMERVKKAEDNMQGWVLDGFPRTSVQVTYLKERAVVPTNVLYLQAGGEWIRRRSEGLNAAGLEALDRKLRTYNCHCNALQTYEDKATVINAELGEEAVWQEVERSVRRMPHSKSSQKLPPRVVVYGPHGVGAHEHASRLAADLGAVLVDWKYYKRRLVENGYDVAELLARLRQADCRAHGWVLCGLPVDGDVAELLRKDAQLSPTRVAVLDASAETCVSRLHQLLLDPVTGKVWTSLPENERIRARLIRRAEDQPAAVEAEHAEFLEHLPAVLRAFSSVDGGAIPNNKESSCQQIPADGPPPDVFSALADFVERPLSLRPRKP